MDRDERIDSRLVALRRAFRGFQVDIWTALPAIVETYDPVKRTVSLQPAIQAQVENKATGEWANLTLPILPDVPVLFPGAGDYVLTFPIKAGDEGLVVFSSRCIDAFWQQGGVQPQAEIRMHDLSDGIFLPGALSQKQDIPDISADNVQLRSKDGTRYIEISDTKITLKSDVAVIGSITATQDITAGEGGADQIGLMTHKHGGVQVGGGSTTVPTPGT